MNSLTLEDKGLFKVTTWSGTVYTFLFDENGKSGFRNPPESLHNPKEIRKGLTLLGNKSMMFDVDTLHCIVGKPMYMDIIGGTYGLDWISSTEVVSIERIEND